MRKLYFVILCLTVSLTTMAQAGTLMWQKCFGGSGADSARSIANTSDGGYYVAGVTYSNDGNVTGNHNPTGNFSDAWVIKIDKNGALVWQKTFGGSYQDQANSIFATSDGGAIIAGSTNSSDGDVDSLHGTAGGAADFWVVKIDNTGALQWQGTYGGSNNDYARSVIQTTDGGYIVTGSTYSNDDLVSGNHDASGATADFWVLKLSSTGGVQWQKCYGGSLQDDAAQIEQTSDGGYVVAGTTSSLDGNVSRTGILSATTNSLYWLAKLDNTGGLTWQSPFGGTYGSIANGVVQTSDLGYVISGYTYADDDNVPSDNFGGSSGSTADNWIVKASGSGGLDWGNCWGGSLNDYARGIRQSRDGSLIITGSTTSDNGQISDNHGTSGTEDLWTYELKASGYATYWYGTFGGSGNDAGFDVTESTDSNFVEAGTTNSTDGNVTGNNGGYDFWIVKVQSNEGAATTGIENINGTGNTLNIYPNPAADYTTITVNDNLVGSNLELTDAVGRVVSNQLITSAKFRLQTGSFAKGVYLVKVAGNDEAGLVKKLVVE